MSILELDYLYESTNPFCSTPCSSKNVGTYCFFVPGSQGIRTRTHFVFLMSDVRASFGVWSDP